MKRGNGVALHSYGGNRRGTVCRLAMIACRQSWSLLCRIPQLLARQHQWTDLTAGVPADAAVCALESLINSNRLHVPGQQHASDSQPSAIAYVKAATAGDSGAGLVGLRSLCSKDGQLLEPQEALLW